MTISGQNDVKSSVCSNSSILFLAVEVIDCQRDVQPLHICQVSPRQKVGEVGHDGNKIVDLETLSSATCNDLKDSPVHCYQSTF